MLKRLLKNSAWGTLGTGTGRILNLLAMILLARSLSLTDFGYFGLVQATLGVFAIFAGAGLGVTATRFLAEYRHTDLPRAGRILGLVWNTAFITIGAVLLIVLLASGRMAQGLVQVGEVGKLTAALMLGGVFFALQTVRGIQDSILMGLERFREVAALKLAEGLLVLLLMPPMAAWQGLLGAFAGLILGTGLALTLGWAMTSRATRGEGIATDWSGMRGEWPILRSFSLPSMMSGMVATPVLWFGIWMLSRQPDGITQVALYNAAYQWHGPLVLVPMVLCAASMPVLVQAWTAGEMRQFRRMYLILSATALGVGMLPALALALLREPIMASYGPEYLAGQWVLVSLLLAAPFHAVANIGGSTLQSMARAWMVMCTTILWTITFLIALLSFGLKYGAEGMASALALAYVVLALFRTGYVVSSLRVRPE